jgi:methylated-DNA-[protein]-cysteine S-methyltransferase
MRVDIVWRSVGTSCGFVDVGYTAAGLYALSLPGDDAGERFCAVSAADPAWLQALAGDLRRYFAGEPVTFTCPVDDSGYPPFFTKVLQKCASIPYGERQSYRWLAEEAGSPKAVRAAGQAMAHNRTPVVIPCHRVLRNDGNLGGFSGGLGWKEKLLALESHPGRK